MADMLTIAEIVRRTGMGRDALNRYLAQPAIRELFGGAATHPLYPAESVPLFLRLAEQHSKGMVTPKTLQAAWTAKQEESETLPAVVRSANTARVPNNAEPFVFTKGADATLTVIVGQEDSLLTREEAAKMLRCHPRSVGRYVLPVRKGVWKRSDVQKYIESL